MLPYECRSADMKELEKEFDRIHKSRMDVELPNTASRPSSPIADSLVDEHSSNDSVPSDSEEKCPSPKPNLCTSRKRKASAMEAEYDSDAEEEDSEAEYSEYSSTESSELTDPEDADDFDTSENADIDIDESELVADPTLESIQHAGNSLNTMKRRTNPRSFFEVEDTHQSITRQEQNERLEALVKQSQDVSRKLNEAMEVENQRNEEAMADRPDWKPNQQSQNLNQVAVWPTAKDMKLQPHQQQGVRWMLARDGRGVNVILADEMGLGKTIQSIAFLATISIGENRGPHLIIVPSSVVSQWAAEFENFYPGKFKVLTHIGIASERFERLEHNLMENPDFDFMVTSYELAQRDLLTKVRPENKAAWAHRRAIHGMQKLEFEYAVFDEAHRLKNFHSKFSTNLRKYTQAKRRLLLTGTPLSNDLEELWGLMNVLNPRIFGSHFAFNEWFAAPFDTSRSEITVKEQSLIVSRLHTVLRPFFKRRLRADVCPLYSSENEVVVKCPQSALQIAMQSHYLNCRKTKGLSANNTFMMLRRIANHPYVHCSALCRVTELHLPKVLICVSGKFCFLYYALPRLISGGHRVLIFSQFRKVLDILEDLMDMLKFQYARFDGETSMEDRDDAVLQFNDEESKIPIFLLTTRAGGVGLNLQTADTVVLFDSDWNPSADLQAVSRIQRIGQKRVVHVMRLVTDNSIDEVIVNRGREKLRTEAVAVGAGKFNTFVDPKENSEVRQKELEAILIKYETTPNASENFLEVNDGISVNAVRHEAAFKARIKEWAAQLLRKDEKSLPENTRPIARVESNHATIPEWLKPGYDMKTASLAMKCDTEYELTEILKNAELKKAPLQARAARPQFFFLSKNDGSDKSDALQGQTEELNRRKMTFGTSIHRKQMMESDVEFYL